MLSLDRAKSLAWVAFESGLVMGFGAADPRGVRSDLEHAFMRALFPGLGSQISASGHVFQMRGLRVDCGRAMI